MEAQNPAVLIVDDEPWNIEVIESCLHGRGYDITRAANGEEALKAVAASPPDIVLLDVIMPGMDGYEVCRRIKEDDKTRFIPVVMVTSLDQKSDKVSAIQAGADDFITKPVDKAELLARTSTALRMKRYHDERNAAYSEIRRITRLFNETVRGFDPMRFTLKGAYDAMFASMLRRAGDDRSRPACALVLTYGRDGFGAGTLYIASDGAVAAKRVEFADPRAVAERFGRSKKRDLYVNGPVEGLARELEDMTGPVVNMVSCRTDRMLVACFNYGKTVGAYDAQVLGDLAAHAAFFDTIAGQVKENEEAFLYTIKALARAAEANDEDTGNHIIRVNEYSYEIARGLGLAPKLADTIRYSAQMHDVGKIHVHPDILRKPGKLTAAEWETMKKHTVYGPRILGGSTRLEVACQIALRHHERWDGSGYPDGLGGEDIPLAARVVAIGDVYDALRNGRVYKPAFDHETACGIIARGDGRVMPGHFDPEVHALFMRAKRRFEEIYHELGDVPLAEAA